MLGIDGHRWANHKCPSKWKEHSNNPLYLDMQKYGLDKFSFQILAPVMPEYLKQVEQEFIKMLKPVYNNYRANGVDVERQKETQKRYEQSEKFREYNNKYRNQLCLYNGEELTLNALSGRFYKAGIKHPVLEAKKYILEVETEP